MINIEVNNLVDLFVRKVNNSDKEPVYYSESSPSILVGTPDDYDFSQWEIKPASMSSSINALEQRLGQKFPVSYCSLVSRYIFPSFVFNKILLFGNTVDSKDIYELKKRLFADLYLSEFLISKGFIQIGIPASGIYDPICFDANTEDHIEFPIVQLGHEAILQAEKVKIVKHIANSFLDLIKNFCEK